jgi:hypothetical protein
MHYHLQTKRVCFQIRTRSPLVNSLRQIRFQYRRMSLRDHHRFGRPPPYHIPGQWPPHLWGLLPPRTQRRLVHRYYRRTYRCLRGACASGCRFGSFASQ